MMMTKMMMKAIRKPPKRLNPTKLTCFQITKQSTTTISVENHLAMSIMLVFPIRTKEWRKPIYLTRKAKKAEERVGRAPHQYVS
jgi:hypothetical protein